MRFSTRSEYGLRAIIELGRHWGNPPVSIKKVAEKTDIPYQYLEQLVQKLRKGGLVNALRGVRGGYVLSRNPSEMTVGDVLRSVEGDLAPYRCPIVGPYQCPRQGQCVAKYVWEKVAKVVNAAVDEITIGSLIKKTDPSVSHA